MDDVSIRVTGAEAVKGREAGNTLIIDHGGGWETQYGHLRRGSIAVRPGDIVAAGQPIALIGLSGHTEFTHVHFEVRRDGTAIDPYTATAMGAACGAPATPLWTDSALAALPYREDAVFDAGFAHGAADPWIARAGGYAAFAPSADSPALVFWIDVLGHRSGDRQSIRLLGPGGAVIAEAADTADETRVQWFQFVGKKRPASGWPPGRYRGEYTLTRTVAGQPKTVIDIRRAIELR
jgi:murein DD-endopeptidase MepM/ murein hydrolase activator NlpD